MNSRRIIETLAAGEDPSGNEIYQLLNTDFGAEETLFAAADDVRRRFVGDVIHLRAIIEFSNYCERNCVYCGLRRDNISLNRYRMSPDEIVDRAVQVYEMGYRTVA